MFFPMLPKKQQNKAIIAINLLLNIIPPRYKKGFDLIRTEYHAL